MVHQSSYVVTYQMYVLHNVYGYLEDCSLFSLTQEGQNRPYQM